MQQASDKYLRLLTEAGGDKGIANSPAGPCGYPAVSAAQSAKNARTRELWNAQARMRNFPGMDRLEKALSALGQLGLRESTPDALETFLRQTLGMKRTKLCRLDVAAVADLLEGKAGSPQPDGSEDQSEGTDAAGSADATWTYKPRSIERILWLLCRIEDCRRQSKRLTDDPKLVKPGSSTNALHYDGLASSTYETIRTVPGWDRLETACEATGKGFCFRTLRMLCAKAAKRAGKTLDEIEGWDAAAVADLLEGGTPPKTTSEDQSEGTDATDLQEAARVPQSFTEIADTARILYTFYKNNADEYRRAKSGLQFVRDALYRTDPEQASTAFPPKGSMLDAALRDYTCQSERCAKKLKMVGNLATATATLLPALWPSLRLVGGESRWHEDEGFNWDAAIEELRKIEAAAISTHSTPPDALAVAVEKRDRYWREVVLPQERLDELTRQKLLEIQATERAAAIHAETKQSAGMPPPTDTANKSEGMDSAGSGRLDLQGRRSMASADTLVASFQAAFAEWGNSGEILFVPPGARLLAGFTRGVLCGLGGVTLHGKGKPIRCVAALRWPTFVKDVDGAVATWKRLAPLAGAQLSGQTLATAGVSDAETAEAAWAGYLWQKATDFRAVLPQEDWECPIIRGAFQASLRVAEGLAATPPTTAANTSEGAGGTDSKMLHSTVHDTLAADPDFDRKFMEMAVNEARKSKSEDERVHPMVGAVVVKGGRVLATAHRGELRGGDHAEFTALEKKLPAEAVAGATIYTTLEPCTSRKPPKTPCADWLIARRVKRVVIGMHDPNPTVYGGGWARLQEAGITTADFDGDLKDEIKEMNREFIWHYKRTSTEQSPPDGKKDFLRPTGTAVENLIQQHNALEHWRDHVRSWAAQDTSPVDLVRTLYSPSLDAQYALLAAIHDLCFAPDLAPLINPWPEDSTQGDQSHAIHYLLLKGQLVPNSDTGDRGLDASASTRLKIILEDVARTLPPVGKYRRDQRGGEVDMTQSPTGKLGASCADRTRPSGSAFSMLDRYPTTPAGHVAFIELVRDEVHFAAEAKRQQLARSYSNATLALIVQGIKWVEARKRIVALPNLPAGAVEQVASVLRRDLTVGTVEQIDDLLTPAVRGLRDAWEGNKTTGDQLMSTPGAQEMEKKKAKLGLLDEETLAAIREREERSPQIREAKLRAEALKKRRPKRKRQTSGKGFGLLTGPTSEPCKVPNPNRDKVFISYSHKDRKFLNELLAHLKPLERASRVAHWSDDQIQPGSKSLEEIRGALALSKVAVLLVTKDFLASDFIHEHELGPLLKEAEKGGVKILWVSVRACSYKETPLRNYQAVIPPDKPLAKMGTTGRDEAWVKICEEIKKAANS